VAHGDASATDLAYLTDRVLLAQAQPQRFGTQVTVRNGGWVPLALDDGGRVDERRAAVGLGPLVDYLASFAEDGMPAYDLTVPCRGCAEGILLDALTCRRACAAVPPST
jgi:hypothetical protein